MESTGVYWVAVFEILEAGGIEVYLVNARHMKGVPGRKSDVADCQWIQKLHSLGLLSASFRPDSEMRALRTYLRHRAELINDRVPHIQHMQKALQQMNILLPPVLTATVGETGLAIIRVIVAGERDSVKLAQLRDLKCRYPEETFAKALTGNWQDEHLFVLQQSLALYDFYTDQLIRCDGQLQQLYSTMKSRWTEPVKPAPQSKPKAKHKRRKNEPASDVGTEIVRLTGVDLAAVGGIGPSLAQTILAEGTDMSKWATDKHFTSWLGLVPHNFVLSHEAARPAPIP